MKCKTLLVVFLLASFGFTACSGTDGPIENGNQVGDVEEGDDDGDDDGEGDDETPAPLALNGISPDRGPAEGGTVVTLSGTGFQEGMTVYFDNARAPSVTRYGQLSAEVVTPEGPAGPVDVTVVNPDDEEAVLVGAFVYEAEDTGPREGVLGYCQLQPQSTPTEPLLVSAGEEFGLRAVVYVEDLTEGEGRGEGVEIELGVGADFDSLQWAPMEYLGDSDGISAGDLANDEYIREIMLDEVGDYIYFARAKGPGDDDWVQCGRNGPVLGLPMDSAFGRITVEEASDDEIRPESCGIQFPRLAQDLVAGEDFMLYGRVYEPGVTDQADLPGEFLAEALIGPAGANPEEDLGAFEVLTAVRNLEYVNDDFEEFEVSASVAEAGVYGYVFRFSLDDGAHWTYCDIENRRREEEVDPEKFGALVISESAPVIIEYCRTFEVEFIAQEGEEGPAVWMEIYHGGLTDEQGVDNSDAFEVEAGFGVVGANPALSSYEWASLSYAGVGPSNPNNYEFSGPLYTAASGPDSGQYDAITRVRLAGEEGWTYCNHEPGEPNFSLDVVSRLLVEP